MISLLLLPLLLLPSIQGQTFDMAEVEERLARMEERMEERMKERMEERVEERLARIEERMEERIEGRVEEKMRKKEEEMEAKVEEREAELRKEIGEKEEVLRKELVSVVTQELRDQPYLIVSASKGEWTSPFSTITYDSFLTDFNNGDRPGGADGQLDLGTGVFSCLREGIYSIDFAGYAYLWPEETVRIYVFVNGVQVEESYWQASTYPGTVDYLIVFPGSRSLMLPLKLGDTVELRTDYCTGSLKRLVLNIQLADHGLSIPRH